MTVQEFPAARLARLLDRIIGRPDVFVCLTDRRGHITHRAIRDGDRFVVLAPNARKEYPAVLDLIADLGRAWKVGSADCYGDDSLRPSLPP